MTLSEYIAQIGDEAAAAQFGVSARTAAAWRRGETRPRIEVAFRIQALTERAVTFEECFPQEAAQ